MLFSFYFIRFRTVEYVPTYKNFLFVTSQFLQKVPLEIESSQTVLERFCELSISSGTFFENYDVTQRKLLKVGTYSNVRKQIKQKVNNIVETTNKEQDQLRKGIICKQSCSSKNFKCVFGASWSIRQNPEDRINIKPDDKKTYDRISNITNNRTHSCIMGPIDEGLIK